MSAEGAARVMQRQLHTVKTAGITDPAAAALRQLQHHVRYGVEGSAFVDAAVVRNAARALRGAW